MKAILKTTGWLLCLAGMSICFYVLVMAVLLLIAKH